MKVCLGILTVVGLQLLGAGVFWGAKVLFGAWGIVGAVTTTILLALVAVRRSA